ncbi:50S ribosomal protein L30 [Polyangium sp. 15x6]|uniref:50S ribosomal protein L30 n=1 Tax=Polyangium sp. 15x6 TaxID=3042687 RepID=UPI00249B7934|nr:50S ribosomal protein L30 [Polyangium sp. 15x6]MDI3289972.1 50S ribosomal protein L30 [Polyangium sp. 15x6]
MKTHLRVRQTGSVTNQTEHTRKVLRGLGLRKPGNEVLVANTPSFRGMVKKVIHLVSVEEVDGNGAQASK